MMIKFMDVGKWLLQVVQEDLLERKRSKKKRVAGGRHYAFAQSRDYVKCKRSIFKNIIALEKIAKR